MSSYLLAAPETVAAAAADCGVAFFSAVSVSGSFVPDDAVEIAGPDGTVFAKGLVRLPSARAPQWLGRRTEDLPEDLPHEVVHRDDLVMLA